MSEEAKHRVFYTKYARTRNVGEPLEREQIVAMLRLLADQIRANLCTLEQVETEFTDPSAEDTI